MKKLLNYIYVSRKIENKEKKSGRKIHKSADKCIKLLYKYSHTRAHLIYVNPRDNTAKKNKKIFSNIT